MGFLGAHAPEGERQWDLGRSAGVGAALCMPDCNFAAARRVENSGCEARSSVGQGEGVFPLGERRKERHVP